MLQIKLFLNSIHTKITLITTENFLFGKGYMTLWFDNPLLQSYLDMGIYGTLCCFYFFVLLPLRTLFSKKIYDNYWVYHTEAIENAFADIDSLLDTGKHAW